MIKYCLNRKKYIFNLLVLALLGLFFIAGSINYPGSMGRYYLFSIIFFLMLLSGIGKEAGYAYFFFVIMLWLGFWLKASIHFIYPYPFSEYTGQFDFNVESWDVVLLVAIIGAAGVLSANIIFRLLSCNKFEYKSEMSLMVVPSWYGHNRLRIWMFFMGSVLCVAILNIIYGFQQSGLVPRTIIGYHLNGVIYHILAVSFPIFCATLLGWDIKLKKNPAKFSGCMIVAASVVSISLLSRGALIFQAFPQLMALFDIRIYLAGFKVRQVILVGFLFLLSIFITFSIVNSLRGHYYSNGDIEVRNIINIEKITKPENNILRFAIDRWIGLEGVMAVVAYPKKDGALFLQGLKEKSSNGSISVYQEISLSHYRFMDSTKYRFSSLPGLFGFLYYSGSLVLIYIGALGLTLGIIFFEYLTLRVTKNIIAGALIGAGLANSIIQIGVAPSNLLPFYFSSAASVFIVFLIQNIVIKRIPVISSDDFKK